MGENSQCPQGVVKLFKTLKLVTFGSSSRPQQQQQKRAQKVQFFVVTQRTKTTNTASQEKKPTGQEEKKQCQAHGAPACRRNKSARNYLNASSLQAIGEKSMGRSNAFANPCGTASRRRGTSERSSIRCWSRSTRTLAFHPKL